MKQIIISLGLLLLLITYSCSGTGVVSPVSLTWSNDGYNAQTESYDNTFTIKNISGKTIGKSWAIYFSQLPRTIKSIHSEGINIEVVNANFFKISPTSSFEELEAGDSIIVKYSVSNNVPNISQQPEGCYWILDSSSKNSVPVTIDLQILSLSNKDMTVEAVDRLFRFNESINPQSVLLQSVDILPSVKQIDIKKGKIAIPNEISLLYSNELINEAKVLQDKLHTLYGIGVSEVAPLSVRLTLVDNPTANNEEWYSVDIDTEQIMIKGITSHGIFNGVQTLLALMKGDRQPNELGCITITDYPDLLHRGFMLDISRNFTNVSDLKSLIDVLASYKINVLHLHFCDDEGWRLEIPGLEELTEVGSKRGHTADESASLYPGYDGYFDPNGKTSGNGYYTRKEFIDLLKYAEARHVRILPELESPGHARAAVVSMKARYKKYIAKDEVKAKEYLLSEDEDASVYVSAQSYTDNVMNVSLPSTYRFMEKVISEIGKMYEEAGVKLPSIHIGGDEVPAGAWIGSPSCKTFMKEKGLNTAHELGEYFFRQITTYMRNNGLQFNGWQEVALHNSMATDKQLSATANSIFCWNTVPEWGDDEIPYKLANKGYPVVLCNVNNFYMDLAYNSHYQEPGHSWAGYVDESKSFSMLPFSLYRSSRTNIAGTKMNLDSLEMDKEQLRADRISLIKGVQAQLFTETIRSFDRVQYYVFPKIWGLVERGWNAHPVWEKMHGRDEEKAFNEDLSHFYALISDKELPYLSRQGINFRLANPGLKIENGYLYANTSVRGATIRYTIDGTQPSETSSEWTSPVKIDATMVKACVFYLNKKSLTTTLTH